MGKRCRFPEIFLHSWDKARERNIYYGCNNPLDHSGAVLILFVLGQSGKHSGLGMISGASDSFLSKNKAKSADAKLARWTKWVAIVFIVLTLVLNFL